MSTLAVDKPRVYKLTGAHPDYNEIPAITLDIIYEGAAVGESASAGTGRPLVAADVFLGFCQDSGDHCLPSRSLPVMNVTLDDRSRCVSDIPA